MPFRPSSLPEQIRSNAGSFRDAVESPPQALNAGAAIAAKSAAYDWERSKIRNPSQDSASPWGPSSRPFSELVTQNPQAFANWGDRFRNSTYMGFDFAPPPPSPAPNDSKTNNNTTTNNNTNNNPEDIT